jgi:putative endonuclease
MLARNEVTIYNQIMKNTTAVGKHAEDLAAKYLQDQKYEIIDRNYRDRFCEIDIIARNKECICFVEVKFRNTTDFGGGFGAIHSDKQRRLQQSAEYWLSSHPEFQALQPRIDVIAVDQNDQIEHLENALY